jgi:hypothetical protein
MCRIQSHTSRHVSLSCAWTERICRTRLAAFVRKGRMTISVTAKHQNVTGLDFFPQLFQVRIDNGGFRRNASYAVQDQPYPMDRGGRWIPVPAPGWVHTEQAGHSNSGVTKTSRLISGAVCVLA